MSAWRLSTALMLAASLTAAGDYVMIVSDDLNSSCAQQRRPSGGVVLASQEVDTAIGKYFRGEEPDVPVFVAAFGNGRVLFCGKSERVRVYSAWLRVARQDRVVNERHLFDHAMMLGDETLLRMIEDSLTAGATDERVAARLGRMRAAVVKGIELRK